MTRGGAAGGRETTLGLLEPVNRILRSVFLPVGMPVEVSCERCARDIRLSAGRRPDQRTGAVARPTLHQRLAGTTYRQGHPDCLPGFDAYLLPGAAAAG